MTRRRSSRPRRHGRWAGGYASAGLVAYIVISKYQHHLPLYRQEAMSAQWGAALSRKSMVDWVRIAADWAEPIYKLMLAELLSDRYLQCDETLSIRMKKAVARSKAIFG